MGATSDPESEGTAPPEALPDVLRDPPWTRPRRKPAPKKQVELTRLAHPVRVDWRGDERERWRRPAVSLAQWSELDEAGWRAWIERALAHDHVGLLLLGAPRAVAVELARRWEHVPRWNQSELLLATVARLEADALPLVERWSTQPWGVEAALPLGAPSLAPNVARGLGKATAREVARAWLVRHPVAAAIGLVPDALGRDSKARAMAVDALALLLREGHDAAIEQASAAYGAEAAAALAPLLEVSPLDAVPKGLPEMPAFWDPATLPAPVLRVGGALPREAMEHLGIMLAFSKPGVPYAGVRMVKEACNASSIVDFSWALFEKWLEAGAPNDESWAFLQLGWLGDDSVAYRLATRMKAWPGQGAAKRAEKGLDVLAEMESDVALVLVHQLAQKGRGSLRSNAKKKLARLAAVRGLGEAELGDRLVPTLELDEAGSMLLDYGSRTFRVGFDEELLPFVETDSGERLRALPKPGKRDDPALAPAAEARFKALKKAVRTVAKTQLTRLEHAMTSERRWSGLDFRRYVVAHPLLVHVARRLVFAIYGADARLVSFRVTDDGGLADVDDEPLALPDGARVGIAHPVELTTEIIERWRETFEDYELLQPFPQLARERVAATPEERAAVLASALGVEVPPQRVAALEDAGWTRGPVLDGVRFATMERALGPAQTLVLEVQPGMVAGMVHASDPQTLRAVHVIAGGVLASLETLSAIAFSELVRDLRRLAG